MLVEVADASQVAAARRAAASVATARGFDETKAGRVALIATELATNMVKHAQRGEIVLGDFADSSGAGVELVALDKGGGIADLGRAMQDGASTAGSPGTGLGAIQRQSDRFDIFTRPNLGTVIASRILDESNGPLSAAEPVISAIVWPYKGETLSGDAWTFEPSSKGPTLLLADGSGHGALANVAAQTAVRTLRDRRDEDCPALAQDIHRALGPTRGAAIGIARLDRISRLVRYVGVGNISAAVVGPDGQIRRMVSHNGTAGHVAPRIAEFTYPAPRGSLVLMHSDGISSKWDLAAYPGLAASHPSLVAGVLFRDFRRGNDDVSVVAMRV